jgi:hypothetical protein
MEGNKYTGDILTAGRHAVGRLPYELILNPDRAKRAMAGLLFLLCAGFASGRAQNAHATVIVTVVDEDGVAVSDAHVTITEPGLAPARLHTNYAGSCSFELRQQKPYQIHVDKPGFYVVDENGVEASLGNVKVTLAHEQMVREQVNVTASTPGIDTEQISDKSTMNTPEIINIPYHTSRDIRYLLPFIPGVVQDATEQVHVAGSETWETLDTLDGFDIRSPLNGVLSLRVSADAVRSIDSETTRYPVEFGRSTGGVIALYTGMGDDKFRFNATNFIPSFRDLNGIRFDQFVPRFTFSGPLKRGRAWWYDGVEMEWDNIYIPELPANANTDELVRGSNLVKVQDNLSRTNILTAGLLYNAYHSPYDGLSALVPQQSTVKRNTPAWLPYVRDQQSFANGTLLDVGIGYVRIRDGDEPHGNSPYEITPELAQGSYFENETGVSQRLEGNGTLYLPPRQWMGQHNFQLGVDVDRVGYSQKQTMAPVSYLREDGTLDRRSVFAPAPSFTMHNAEIGGYIEDRWHPAKGWLVEPGFRFDWDEIVRRPLFSPRFAAVYSPPGDKSQTKISAGIGIYYEHTQLSYLAQPFTGVRYDTYFAADGVTPTGPAQETQFTANDGLLHEPRAVNWSVGVERMLPWSIIGGANFLQKRTSNVFTFANQSGTTVLAGNYLLTNDRQDRYDSEEFDLKKLFANGYTLYVSYTHSSARTNAALDYLPTPSPLGPQQSGPLAWDTPNHVISWGWLPIPFWKLKKRWDFVYLIDRHSGFPYTAVNAADQVVGAAGAYRFPAYVDFSPGLEWKFHFRGQYWGLRGVMENATDSLNPLIVNNNIDSPQFGTFPSPEGRAFTARIRLIGTK